jgi:restriction system protein
VKLTHPRGALHRGQEVATRVSKVLPVAVPDFQSLMRPFLVALEDGDDHDIKAIRADLAERLSLSQEDIDELIPSGTFTTFQNRVGWAATYLYRTKLVARRRRAVYYITDRGRQVLAEHSERVDIKVLARFEELKTFQTR